MKRRAGIIGAALTGLALSAHAYTSAYTSLAVPGTHNGWNAFAKHLGTRHVIVHGS